MQQKSEHREPERNKREPKTWSEVQINGQSQNERNSECNSEADGVSIQNYQARLWIPLHYLMLPNFK